MIAGWKSKQSFFKDLRSKKTCFFPVIANIFDQSSDIGFIFGMYALMNDEQNGNDCENVNATYLFSLSLFFFLFYRITSAVMVFIETRNIWYSIGQLLFEYMLYRSMYVNYRLKCVNPSSPQQWLQNMESMLEAFPQLILQMFYMIQIEQLQGFVIFSIAFSMLSMVNKAVSEDKPLFKASKWRDAGWKIKKFPCANPLYLLRVFFRVFDVSHRVLVIVIIWYEFGGEILFVTAGIEFLILLVIVVKTKELSPSRSIYMVSALCFVCHIKLFSFFRGFNLELQMHKFSISMFHN